MSRDPSDTQLALDVHGVQVRIVGDPQACAGLARHFAGFVIEDARAPAAIRVALRATRSPLDLPAGHAADQIVERGLVYNLGSRTVVDHHGHALSRFDFSADEGSVEAEALEDRIELGYLMVSSRLGVHLEARGLVRVHGIGLAHRGVASLVLAPSGGGKSTLARALLRHTEARLLGDDMVLLDRRGFVHAFPTPIGLTDPSQARGLGEPVAFPRRLHPPKWILPLEALAGRIERRSLPLASVVVLRRVVGPEARLRVVGRGAVAGPLVRDAIVGLGLPQVVELVVRHGARDLPRMAPSVLRRSIAVAAALARAEGLELDGGAPEDCARLLVADLERRAAAFDEAAR